jgi:hypothetical protein
LALSAYLFNEIALKGYETSLTLRLRVSVWVGLDKHRSFQVPFPCLTVLGRHP